jgi:hypothetical protein
MAFSPGQFITAQRINRLQPKTYWAAISGTMLTVVSNTDVPGCSISIPVETNGATAAFTWHLAAYGNTTMTNSVSSRVLWDVNVSPVVAVGDFRTASEKGTVGQNWVTTIGTAGTYTFKMQASIASGGAVQIYTAMTVVITEVA